MTVMSIDEKNNRKRKITMILIQIEYPNLTALCEGKQEAYSAKVGDLASGLEKLSIELTS